MSHFISLEQAISMTSRYRKDNEQLLKDEFKGKNILALSETFDRKEFETVLNQQGCTGLRIYYGMDEERKVHAIIVGVDAQDNDILPANTIDASTVQESIIEVGKRCPVDCPTVSLLNS